MKKVVPSPNGETNYSGSEGIEGVYDAELLAIEVARIIYNNGKAKVFNVLESQFDGQRLNACRRIVQDIFKSIAKDAADFIKDVLGDWEIEVVGHGEVSEEDEAEARKQYREIEELIK